jgi:serine protease AprX
VGDVLFRGSGSSQAAAVTSGAVAILLQKYPTLTPDQVKAALMVSGVKVRNDDHEPLDAGLASIDVHRAADKARDVMAGKVPSSQVFRPASGLGTLEGARGTSHVVDSDGLVLTGETDVTGAAWDGRTWRDDTWSGRTWRDASWNGRTWRDDTWSGRTWRDASWNGRTWRSDGWSGRTWRGDGWNGRTWRGNGWLAAEFVPTDPLT